MTDPSQEYTTRAQPDEASFWLGLLTPSRFAVLYAVLGVAHLMAEWLSLAYLTKPLLMPALSIYWWHHTRQRRNRQAVLMQVALLFAWLGDVLLLFQQQNPLFFLLGLGAFLIMQVLYAAIFSADAQRPKATQIGQMLGIAGVVGWTASRIWPQLPPDMVGPVAVYMLAIMIMVYLALLRQKEVSPVSFGRVYAGALFFLVSDTLIALNRFLTPAQLVGFFVMPTYIVAQYLIVTGLLAGRQSH